MVDTTINSVQNEEIVAAVDSHVSHALSNGTSDVTNLTPVTLLPKGKYTVVSIDIDTTGRRLIDEIVQLAVYTPDDHFEQYIMPYMNLNPAARQRHQVRVISIGFYRMLKSMQTYKIIKSKSEIAALKDFLDWLEALKTKTDSLIVLLYHEERKFIPYMILESLKKYNLLDRFLSTVKSFANGFNLAKDNVNESLQRCTLRKLSKVLSIKNAEQISAAGDDKSNVVSSSIESSDVTKLNMSIPLQDDRDIFEGNASVRAKLAYDVTLQLSSLKSMEAMNAADGNDKLLTALQPYAQPIDFDLNELQTQNENLERQNSFRPVFLNYFKTTIYHRVRAVKFRIILAEQGYDLQTLNAIWSEKQRTGLVEVLQVIEELKSDDKTELAELFDSFFDPAKSTIKPLVKTNNNRRRNRRGVRNIKPDGNASVRPGTEQGAGGDKQQCSAAGELPDSTTKSPTSLVNVLNGGKTHRGKRNQRSRNNLLKTQNTSTEIVAPNTSNAVVPATAPTAVPAN